MKRACVIGWPIAHSRSPLIHNYWLRQHGIEGTYEKVAIDPDSVTSFIGNLGRDFAGCNVTVPHKEAVIAALDEVDDTARAIGAVNTIWFEDGKARGTNTDALGFLANLDEGALGWDKAPISAVVLGAGGAARAVMYGLQQRGAQNITIVNRSRDRAEDLAGEFGGTAAAFDELPTLLGEATLVVNATSLGMKGAPPLAIDLAPLNLRAVVNDLVYVPLVTPLLEQASARGNAIVGGLGMLLHQAAPGFEKWFGVRPDVTPELRKLVEDDIRSAA